MSTSSINILPSNASNILNKHNVIVLFPLPVLPAIPIFSFGNILKDIFFNTISVSGL